MIHPIITLPDNTEITASRIQNDGNYHIYIEAWDSKLDAFKHIDFLFPEGKILSAYGYDSSEISKYRTKLTNIEEDIFGFIEEKDGVGVRYA